MTSNAPLYPFLEVTQEAGRRYFSQAQPGPVVLLNLLRFRAVADYFASPALVPPQAITGAEAYERYVAHAQRPGVRSCSLGREPSISLVRRRNGGTWYCWFDIKAQRASVRSRRMQAISRASGTGWPPWRTPGCCRSLNGPVECSGT